MNLGRPSGHKATRLRGAAVMPQPESLSLRNALSPESVPIQAQPGKRAMDLVLGLLIGLFVLPLCLFIALAIRLESPGPVIFRQRRVGLGGEIFVLLKFRTMYYERCDADGHQQATRDDPRITRVGRFLRVSSLDELPQILNVIGGSMSLVGPRPHPLGMSVAGKPVDVVVADYHQRHRVMPGVTGWAQVNGWRGETSTPEKLEGRVTHDLAYIERWSLGFDALILVMTIGAVLRCENAR